MALSYKYFVAVYVAGSTQIKYYMYGKDKKLTNYLTDRKGQIDFSNFTMGQAAAGDQVFHLNLCEMIFYNYELPRTTHHFSWTHLSTLFDCGSLRTNMAKPLNLAASTQAIWVSFFKRLYRCCRSQGFCTVRTVSGEPHKTVRQSLNA